MQTQTRTQKARHPWADQGGHIRGLDGLRALAVAAVVLYHLSPSWLGGGYLGVDVFFVVSGFLITTLLMRDIRTKGRVDLKRFWVRRARRLLPALVILAVTVIPVAALINRDLLVGIGRQLLGALTFSTNWLEIAHGSSYFDNTSPLLFKNFWSLAVEEQFYLFWPLLFILILAFVTTWRRRLAIALGAAGVSAVAMGILASSDDFTRVYYGTDTHMFGLALGVGLAFMWGHRGGGYLSHPLWRTHAHKAGWISLGLLGVLLVVLRDDTMIAYRGGILLASILTAVVIASMLAPGSQLATVGENRILGWVGTRSYGIYLWHWPILVMVRTAFPAAPGSGLWWVTTIVSLGLLGLICEASFRYVETPVRTHGFRAIWASAVEGLQFRSRPVFATVAVASLATVGTLAAVAVAPDKSSVQAAIEQAEGEMDASATPASNQAAPQPGVTDEPASDQPVAALTQMPTGEQMTAIGDSLIVTSKDGLDAKFPGINYLAKSNRKWSDATAVVEQGLAAGVIRDVVVLDYGTNAGVPDPDVVRHVIDLLGSRTIVLVNIYGQSTFIDASNQTLATIADEYDNVILADWHAAISAEPGKLQADGTHPDMQGLHLFASVVHDDLEAHIRP